MAASDLAIIYLRNPIKLKAGAVDADYSILKCRPFMDNNSPLAGSGAKLLNLGRNSEGVQICVSLDNISCVLYESDSDAFSTATYLPTLVQGYIDIS